MVKKKAKLIFKHNSFDIVENGDYVLCAISGKEILLKDNKYQVMMEWEKLYMDTLVQKLNPSGDVLEIGFGLGYSATAIQRYNIKSHTIIEADPEVLKRLRIWADEQKHPVNIIEGSWQKKLPKVTGLFDSFFLDDYPTV